MNRKTILLLIAVLLLAFASTACTASQKPGPPNPTRRPAPTTPAPTTPNKPVQPGGPMTAGTDLQPRAMKIADEVGQIPGVKQAHVVLSDRTGYVGLDLDRNVEGKKVEEIKKEAENKAKSIDQQLNNIMVTTDVDTVTRIKKIAQGTKNGKPISSFTKEMEEIGRRMKPTTGM